MALFASPNANDVDLLFSTGFTARLRRPNGYLGAVDDKLQLVPRKDAAVVHFAGVRRSGAIRATVQVAPARYVDVQDFRVTDDPVILCVHVTPHRASEVRIALTDIRTKPASLTLPEPTAAGVDAGGAQFFVLEVISAPEPEWKVPESQTTALSVPAAVLRAVLALSVRFRLRTVHRRVVRLDGASVRQDGPRTTIAEANEAELLLEPISRGERYLLRVANTDEEHYFALRAGSDNTPHAVLVSKRESGKRNSGALLVIRPSTRWGAFHVGVPDDTGVEWLMAGMRGRIETRRRTGSWEMHQMEYVVQARDAALNEAPVLAVYTAADKATTIRARKRIAANIARAVSNNGTTHASTTAKQPAAAPSSPVASQTSKKKKESTGAVKAFDHTRALAALSLPDEPAESAAESASSAPSPTSVLATGAQSFSGPKSPSESGTTPQTAQNRKLTKRQKRNRRRRAQGVLPQPPKTNTPNSTASAASTPRPSGKGTSTQPSSGTSSALTDKTIAAESTEVATETAPVTGTTASSSPSPSPRSTSNTTNGVSGPPCGACGRPIVGEYTTVMGKKYHRGCLKCAKCRSVLGGSSGPLRMHGGQPHCGRCYANHCAPRCARCTEPILDTVVKAMERTWHRECLTCMYCRNPLGDTFWVFAHKPREPHCNECIGARSAAENTRQRTFAPAAPLPTLGGDSAGNSARMHMRPALPRHT